MKLSMITVAFAAVISLGCANKNTAAPIQTPVAAPQAAPTPALASNNNSKKMLSEQGRDPAQFPAYVEQLKAQARTQGISEATLAVAFANIHFVDRVIQSDRNQLEKKVTLDDYLAKVLTPSKIAQGKETYQRYQPQLSQVTARYGVPERYIVALWGMESGFGKIQGKEDVISALSTLAFEGRREAFFTKELIAALKIIQQGRVEDPQLKGSWAGAIGQSQFMPSSFLTYGAAIGPRSWLGYLSNQQG